MGVMVFSRFVGVHQVGTGLDGITVRQDCDEARLDIGSARLLIRPVVVGQAGAGHRRRQIQRKGTTLFGRGQ
jgi:hypothetical protein